MRLPIEHFKGIESGPCVILGNGPSMNKYQGVWFDCPIIGINLSVEYWPKQEYWVTVANDRLADVNTGRIKAEKAVFTCLHKERLVDPSIEQPVVFANMALDDRYGTAAQNKQNLFGFDLTQPTYKTFGGLYAVQVGLFLGFNPLFLVGFDGGTHHFKPYRRDNIPPEYHKLCFWHVADWLKGNPKYKIYNCSRESKIDWFEYKEPPISKVPRPRWWDNFTG